MAYKNFQQFLELLQTKNLLHHISEPVFASLEITEISRRVFNNNGPALFFSNVLDDHGNKYQYPVVSNLFGTMERIALGLGGDISYLKEIGNLLAFLRQPNPPSSFKEILKLLPIARKVISMPPRIVSTGACQSIVMKEVNLYSLPIQKCWPDDVSPLITWPLVVTKGPTSDQVNQFNLGVYRLQLIGKDKLLMRWLKLRGGAQQYLRWSQTAKHQSFPAAAVIGADPATILAAVMPLPENVSEYNFASLLRGSNINLVNCLTIDLKVPAEAEIILEGEVSFDDYQNEGPFGDHTGYYNEVEKFPVFTVKAITMRPNPVYLTTYTGKPPDEPSVIGEALNEIVIPLIQKQFPEILDFWLPPEGCSYRIAIVSIKKDYPGQAQRIMMGVWSFLRQFIYTKYVIVVDNDINIRNWKEVMWAISTRTDPQRDTTIINNTPIDYLDFASPESGLGSKMGIDATNKMYPETTRKWGKKIDMPQDLVDTVTQKWHLYGFNKNIM
ncbi:UbiD family decarboxylase [Orientia tsutsugamushi]|uniref:UbiD family decarboxylase n=1 Tax=Orientia tsutsugamushi TaxID=784 RepID=UPI0035295A0B